MSSFVSEWWNPVLGCEITELFFLVAMLHFPEVMRRAQEELDNVIGFDRMPDYEDRDSLPYLQAVMNETLRWRPVAVLGGVPHAVTANDEYNGM